MNNFLHKRALLLGVAFWALHPASVFAGDLPTGGQIIAGSGSISQNGSTLTVTQDTPHMAANWQSFSIGQGHTVNFQQPSAQAVALNRVLGSDVSVIQGALNANGKVFLINPNGVTFTPDAQVNVGGLVASTLQMDTDDFMAGHYRFAGDSTQAITNQGAINAPGGTVALIAAKIINEGQITADGGHVLMGAGAKVTLDLGGPVKLQIDEGALQTQIDQGGAIRADGGHVYLTAKAAGELATSVINHTGVTEAKTLSTGQDGSIILLGDMNVGTAHIAGELNATAPAGGDGGFIETSAAQVDIAADTTITAGSSYGKGGLWLIDPFNYIINATAAGNIVSALNTGTDVTVQTTANNASFGGTGVNANGDIKVASAITKTAGGTATLTLEAANVIDLAAPITSTSGALNLVLNADSDANGSGVVIATKGTSLNGGDLSFGVGDTAMLGGVSTLVGGDVYVGGTEQVVFRTGGGRIDLFGELIIANPDGVKFITDNGNARFYGIINGGNKYERITNGGTPYTWNDAFADAKNGTAGGDAVGDSYLATVTSRLENAVVVYVGDVASALQLQDGAWLGGRRVTGIGTDNL
ncbi:MAG TPA: filamentous hemagglutinin N-terminal domain-containing protein [Micavibrio sp.]